MKSKRQAICFGIIALTALAGCSRTVPDHVQAAEEHAPRPRVTAVRVERRDLSRSTELAAEFRPFQEVDVHAKVAGYLKSIAVDVGDRVTAGQVIAILEVPEYAEEMAQA